MNKNVKRTGSGRTKGATSFVEMTLQSLWDKFPNKQILIKVSRIQMQNAGVATNIVNQPLTTPVVQTPVVQITDFNE